MRQIIQKRTCHHWWEKKLKRSFLPTNSHSIQITFSRTLNPICWTTRENTDQCTISFFASNRWFPLHHKPPAYSMKQYFIVFCLGLGHLWATCSLMLHKESWPDFGEDTSRIAWVFTQQLSPFVISPCGSANTLLMTTSVPIPLSYLINNNNNSITFILT